jgi:tRNA threonylcarbamoyladenosine modification (KEOPS) complex  Pcc1 subunit
MKDEKAKMHSKMEKVSGSASLSLNFRSAASAKAAYDALLAEADFSHRGGSRVNLAGKSVRVEIEADDPVSLRASLNSYLRLMHIIKSVEENTE